jgi:hypothetical protein
MQAPKLRPFVLTTVEDKNVEVFSTQCSAISERALLFGIFAGLAHFISGSKSNMQMEHLLNNMYRRKQKYS